MKFSRRVHSWLGTCWEMPQRLLSCILSIVVANLYLIKTLMWTEKGPSLRIISTFKKGNQSWAEVQVCGSRATFSISISELALKGKLLELFGINDIAYVIWHAKEEHDAITAEKLNEYKKCRQ